MWGAKGENDDDDDDDDDDEEEEEKKKKKKKKKVKTVRMARTAKAWNGVSAEQMSRRAAGEASERMSKHNEGTPSA